MSWGSGRPRNYFVYQHIPAHVKASFTNKKLDPFNYHTHNRRSHGVATSALTLASRATAGEGGSSADAASSSGSGLLVGPIVQGGGDEQ